MENITEVVNLISDRLLAAGSSDVAVGDPVQIGKYTVLVLTRTSVGFGSGGGQGEGAGMGPQQQRGRKKGPAAVIFGRGTGNGGGGGVKVRPVGVIALSDDGVQVLPVPEKPGILDKLFEKVPELVERIQELMPESRE